ncbi:MAG: tetratricopeptide repeat protein [candidate division Zixibacteria bacterium]
MTYRNDEVIELVNSRLVAVKINGWEDTTLSNHYGINGYPSEIIANADGTEIDRIWGYAPPEDFIQAVNDYLMDKNTLADYLRQKETAPTMKLYNMIAEKYTGRSAYSDAETFYRKILQSDPTNKEGYSDSALYNMGKMKRRAKQYAAAEEAFQRLQTTYPESDMVDDAVFSIATTKSRAEKYDEAIAAFKAFINDYPDSDLIQDAEVYIPYSLKKKGDNDEALRLFKEFLEKYPDSEDTNWVKRQIKEIENPPEETEGG